MSERRRKKIKNEPRTTPQTKIRELKKDIDAFQTEVDNLLKDISITFPDVCCAVCEGPISRHENDLRCEHVICGSCFRNYGGCPLCGESHFCTIRRFDSSASSDDS